MAVQAAQVYSENNMGLGLGFGFASNTLLGGGGGSSQDLMIMDNACCGVDVNGVNQFCFNMQQQEKQQQYQQQQLQLQQMLQQQQLQQHPQRNQNFDSIPLSMALQAEKQRQEIDHHIRLQGERLRLVLQEQRKQQLEMLLKKIEIKTSALLRQKDEEVAKAANRSMQLEILLKKLEIESQAWQRIAQENEAMVFSLNNSLEQMKEKAFCCFLNNGAEDAESCCDIDGEEEETPHNRADTGEKNRAIGIGFGGSYNKEAEETEQEQRTRKMVMVCKGCNFRDSCVLFLPCRHLCSCKACEAFLDSCPVCLTPKKASIEALIF